MQTQNTRSYRPQTTNFLYLLIGGSIGAAAALLFAPKAGIELRNNLVETGRQKLEGGLETARELKERSMTAYQHLAHHLTEAKSELVQDLMKGEEPVNGKSTTAPLALAQDAVQRQPNGGRRASSIV
jgi:gas vesicle protein